MILYLVPISIIVAVLFAAIAVYRQLMADNEMQKNVSASLGAAIRRPSTKGKLSENLDKQITKLSMAARIEQQLVAADSKMSVSEFLMTRAGFGVAGFVVGWLVSGYVVVGFVLCFVCTKFPAMQLNRQISKRGEAIESQLPDMLSLLTGSLRAGYGLLHACRVVQQEMPKPISTEFARVIKETTLGISLGDALDHMVERVKNEDLEMMVTAIHIQNEVGGSLADVLAVITETIRERIELKGEIRSMTAQQRLTGWMLSLMPIGVGILLMMISPDYMMEVFKPGWPMLIPISAVVMIIVGNLIMRQLMKIEV